MCANPVQIKKGFKANRLNPLLLCSPYSSELEPILQNLSELYSLHDYLNVTLLNFNRGRPIAI